MAKTTAKKPASRTKTVTPRRKPAKKRSNAPSSGTKNSKKPQSGLFITLEGGEGSGKSTQMKMLADWLSSQGEKVVMTREPGGSPGAEAVRHVLLSGAAETLGSDMEAILFAAARADHVDTVIAPALEAGSVVISDRFFDSTRVYQGVSGKAPAELVRQLEHVACGVVWPDLTIIIDVSPEEGMKRAGKRRVQGEDPDRFEKESLELQGQRREAYLEIAKQEPERCVVVDGEGDAKAVFGRIRDAVEKRIGDKIGKRANAPKAKRSKSASRPKLLSHKALTRKKTSSRAAEPSS